MNPSELQQTVMAIQAGRLDDASALCRNALAKNPKQFEALYLLGFVQLRMKKYEDAAKIIGDAIALNPAQADAYYNRGCALQGLGHHGEAITDFESALKRNPSYYDAAFNRATSLLRMRQFNDALISLRALARQTPQDAEIWHNTGEAMMGLGRPADAIASYERALAIAPRSIPTLSKHAAVFTSLRDFETAAADYEKIVAIDPAHNFAAGGLLYSRLNCCDWREFDRLTNQVRESVRAGKRAILPLAFVLVSDSPADQRKCAEIWQEENAALDAEPVWNGERYAHAKIRIAYVSGDFRNHAVARLMAGIIESHDREKFEIIGVSLGPDDDSAMRKRLKSAFDRFYDVNTMTDRAAAQWLRDNEIDIAVDLMIFTGDCRPGIFAHRGAPVQAGFLGYAGTSGATHLDYIIADAIVIPEGDRQHYSEKTVYLPDSFQPNDSQRRAADNKPTREAEGLPEGGFVFCSFNNSCKVQPDIFDIWMRLLKAVNGSVLWLPKYNATEEKNLRREAAARGVPAERLIFAELVPTPEEYLSRLRLADLFLDTLPYNAHTTASDALWMGLPVLTRIGTTYAGRVAASVLTALGLPELIAESAEEYERKALELATTPAALDTLKKKLAANRETTSLFDTLRHCRNMERAYEEMHRRLQSGEPPASFAISE